MRRGFAVHFWFWVGFVFSTALSACNLPQRVSETPPVNVVHTAAARTVAVELTQMAVSSGTPPVLDFENVPTQTTLPFAQTQQPSVTPAATADSTCDRAFFIIDVTYPDDSTVTVGSTFVKTWRLKNIGTCNWTAEYSLVFVQGDAMGAPASVPLTTGIVAPDETIDVSVTLVAPVQVGTYQGYFQLRNAAGVNFGVGTGGLGTFWVKVSTVLTSAATPNP